MEPTNNSLTRNLTARLGRKPNKTELAKIKKLTKNSKNVNGYIQSLVEKNEEKSFQRFLKQKGKTVKVTKTAKTVKGTAKPPQILTIENAPVSSSFTVQQGLSQNRLVSKTVKKKKLTTAEKETRKQEKEGKKAKREAEQKVREEKKLQREEKRLQREAEQKVREEKRLEREAAAAAKANAAAKKAVVASNATLGRTLKKATAKRAAKATTRKVKMPSAETCALCAKMIANSEVV